MSLHPVLSLMMQRIKEGTKPGRREDTRRLALVIEGGAMRGVVSAGMISALEDLGFRDTFDDIYATSVGVITGAYFIAGQGNLGTTTYIDDLRDSRFFTWWRLFKGEPPLSLEYAYDELTHKQKPLDSERVLSSSIGLHPIAACLESGRAEDLFDYQTAAELRVRFKAASCMPFLAGNPIEIAGKNYLDGGIFDSLPYRQAIEGGASDVLVLHSWPLDVLRPEASLVERAVGERIMKKYGQKLLFAYRTRTERYNDDLLDLQKRTLRPSSPYVFSLSPGRDALISHLERDRGAIIRARDSGYRAAKSLLENFREE